MARDGKRKEMQPACRDYTLHLHKRLQGVQFKKRAPRAIRDIKRFATKEMYTEVGSDIVDHDSSLAVTQLARLPPFFTSTLTLLFAFLGCPRGQRPQQSHLGERNQKCPQENPCPRYPQTQRRRGCQGEVLLSRAAPRSRHLAWSPHREGAGLNVL